MPPSSSDPDELGEPPVEQVHLAEIAEHDVARLEVAVEHAARVGEGDGLADLAERAEQAALRVGRGHRGVALLEAAHDLGERLPVEALHREEGRLVGPDAEVVHGHDRRVLELALHPRLALEAHARVGWLASFSLRSSFMATSRPMRASLQSPMSPMPPSPSTPSGA